MDSVIKIVDLWKKGISGPLDVLVIGLSIVVFLVPAVLKLNKMISLNEFDRLLIPKNERNIQRLIVTVYDYLLFCVIYLAFGFLFTFFFNTKTLPGVIGGWFVFIIILLFMISFILLIPRVLVNELFHKKDWRIFNWIKRIAEKPVFSWIFNIQLTLSFIVYSFFLGNPLMYGFQFSFKYYIVLFLLPCFFLYIYRAYNKKNIYEYTCQIINEQEFNAIKPIIKYSIDNDRIIFSSEGNNELILFDKSCNMYFKFEKVDIQRSR